MRRLAVFLLLALSIAVLRAGGPDWMAAFPDDARLSELPIPGTHNSGALREPIRSTATCQHLTIPLQLEAGVRFLDIRCRHKDDDLAIHHGIVFQHQMFADVIADVLAFLDKHPSETVILSIQQTAGAEGNTRDFAGTVNAFIEKNADRWLTGTAIPTLGEARGKIVLLRRYEGDTQGIDATGWEWNSPAHLRVQDRFRVREVDTKWRDIVTMFDETQKLPAGTLCLNFTSGVRNGALGIPDIRSVSDAINPRLARWLSENPTRRRGVVVMDFATPNLCDLIVNSAATKTGGQ
jgi:Phosphatidylinositol-specific phospholipase C, X domain.